MDLLHSVPRFPTALAGFDLRTLPLLRTDVLVIGGGVAGASAALHAADAGAQVLLLVKDGFDATNTAWAQGGIATPQLPGDSEALHVADTLRVGAGIAMQSVVVQVVAGAHEAIRWLQSIGASFDRDGDRLALSREGGHSMSRVVHSNGDATGAEIQRALTLALARHPRITIRSGAFVRDLIVHEGHCQGAIAVIDGAELAIEASTVIVATGGAGQLWRETTNPPGASGDGQALCFRAGAVLADCEFVQFHPTTLYIAGAARSLISEVVRGAGAVLRDRDGNAFMQGLHPMADLAPRDFVSRCILDRMLATGDTHVYLDLSKVNGDPRVLFPSIARICSSFDIDIRKDPIPVHPGAHYMVGGASSDMHGRTSLNGLFAVGEAAASGLHGANRLASNSLLEGAVLGRAAGLAAASDSQQRSANLPRFLPTEPPAANPPRIVHEDILYALKSLMWRQVGLRRHRDLLLDARLRIGVWHHYLLREAIGGRRVCELINMLTVAALVTEGALLREESRGTHFRDDMPTRNDAEFCRRIFLRRGDDGHIVAERGPTFAATDLLV
ncbi:MAG: L-aspartate oxidase [Planctomycetota bacterium]|nr:L-aspartate oxidase [Planctomycetota bacterium]